MINLIQEWFKRAVPTPNDRTFDVQAGVHFEEVSEMLATVKGRNASSDDLVNTAERALKELATALKKGSASVIVHDRAEFLDSLCDQIVTATGCGHMQNLDVSRATELVNNSNWSKFDSQGQPLFDENGKIKKGPNYQKVDLSGLV